MKHNEKRRFVIYCHTNVLNGKPYVGLTAIGDNETPTEAMMRRWDGHRTGARGSSELFFHKAIRKYDMVVWKHELIEIVVSKQVAQQAESFWIADRKTNAMRKGHHGYNMTDGGQFPWMFGRKHSIETRLKISQAGMGRKRSLEACRRNGDSHRGKPKPTLRKAVLQFTLSGEFVAEYPSIIIASSVSGVGQNSICRCCAGTVKRPRQFMWSYRDGDK